MQRAPEQDPMPATPSLVQERTVMPRLQVRCAGIEEPESTLTAVDRVAQELLRNADEVTLAVVQVTRMRHGLHRCTTQLFGDELQHVAGHAEHHNPIEAAAQSVMRALRALKTSDRYSPWTSVHPCSQHGDARTK